VLMVLRLFRLTEFALNLAWNLATWLVTLCPALVVGDEERQHAQQHEQHQ
jgi:hypothetical protein